MGDSAPFLLDEGRVRRTPEGWYGWSYCGGERKPVASLLDASSSVNSESELSLVTLKFRFASGEG